MGKKIVKLTESELINLVRKVIREQKISDLPQNQQSLAPKPNLSSTKSKDLRSTLTPQQQQQVKDITRGQKDLSKQYYSNQTTNKTDNYKVDDHTLNTILSIGAAFIPVVGPFISAGIMLNDAAQYYNEGDSKTAGMMAMFALLPGTGAVISKVPGVKQLGANGMKTLATKLSTKAPLSKLESEVVAGLSANQSLVQQELSKLTAETAKKTAQAVTNQTTKQSLVNIGKKGLVFTGKNVAPYVAAGVAYDKAYDSLNPESEVDLASALDVDISQIPEKDTLEIEF
jgi:hypothetical protein